MLEECPNCTARYAPDIPACPQCGTANPGLSGRGEEDTSAGAPEEKGSNA